MASVTVGVKILKKISDAQYDVKPQPDAVLQQMWGSQALTP